MRRAAPYFLFAVILGTAALVWFSYQEQLAVQKRNTAAPPAPLSSTLNSKAEGFVYATSEGDRTVAELRAKDYREVKNPPHMELDQMELRLFHPDGKTFDLVKAAAGNFYPAESRLSSEGLVEVQMAITEEEGVGNGRILTIKAQGASLEIKTGKMVSDGAVEFQFSRDGGRGSGRALGAEYDPLSHELRLRSQASLRWESNGAGALPIEVSSEEVRYLELESKVYLAPWVKMKKGEFTLEAAAPSEVLLDNGAIRHMTARDAKGQNRSPQRIVEYSARTLNVDYNASGQIEKILAEEDAKLNSVGDQGKMNAQARRMDLFFTITGKDSLLERALANGQAVLESIPPSRNGGAAGEIKVLKSESIEVKMRPGGENIERLEAHAPGTLDFLPQQPTQRKRHLKAERMTMGYGAKNQLESFRAVTVETRTEAASSAPKGSPPMLTTSRDLAAQFHPQTGEMMKLEQWGEFRYQEGNRRAVADRAVQESNANRITLTKSARVWDPTGSTDANEILLDQKSGEFVAMGNVRSTREPDKKGTGSQQPQPTQATADRMESKNSNQDIRYEGNAVMWQGENRLRAPRIDIDRKAGQLKARGGIIHQMVDERSAQARKNGAVLTSVRATEMDYSDKDRVVEYRGKVAMNRPGLEVLSNQLRAYLEEENSERFNEAPGGGIEKAFATGNVRIVETGSERTRKGNGETAEYYTADSRLVLEGGKPEMVDIVRGVEQRRTTGKQLSWFANSNKIIVDGAEQKPTLSILDRKR